VILTLTCLYAHVVQDATLADIAPIIITQKKNMTMLPNIPCAILANHRKKKVALWYARLVRGDFICPASLLIVSL
jgi:hypothetical protein